MPDIDKLKNQQEKKVKDGNPPVGEPPEDSPEPEKRTQSGKPGHAA